MDYELLRNASGYVDYTAYKAIKNVERNEKMSKVNRGEIFEYEIYNSNEKRKALVVSAGFRSERMFQSIVVLSDEQKEEDWVPVVCRGMMYADCSKVSFTNADRLYHYIRTATEEEMAAVDAAIAEQLGLNLGKNIECSEELIQSIHTEPVQVFSDHSEELAAVQKEAEIYKNLYEQLLEKLLGGQQSR